MPSPRLARRRMRHFQRKTRDNQQLISRDYVLRHHEQQQQQQQQLERVRGDSRGVGADLEAAAPSMAAADANQEVVPAQYALDHQARFQMIENLAYGDRIEPVPGI